MNAAPAEMMRAFVNSQKFSNTTEVMEAMKEMFLHVLQQVIGGWFKAVDPRQQVKQLS